MSAVDRSLVTDKVRLEELHDGALWRVVLDAPKGNVLDARMVAELDGVFERAAQAESLKGILLCGAGGHFSFGASVEEHRAEQVASMLASFHALFRRMAVAGVPVLAAVRGVCLGGGLELAAFCQRVFAHPRTSLGQPEIKLGVFAPVGSVVLAERVGRGAADDLLLSGRTVDVAEALGMGLVDQVEEDPEAAALAWAEEHLLPLSASSLRCATRAARFEFNQRFDRVIGELERFYLEQLMSTHDAVEGIESFLTKRQPQWRNR